MSKVINISVEQIDNILPQTQCGLCDYNGCKPYAEAIVNNNEKINSCPPGGVSGLKKLAALTKQNPEPFIKDMKKKQKPFMVAVIREDECIGCVKCIKACPVDAILGGAKQMHTVISNECSGCELCVEPCPVDCIDMVETGQREELTEKQFQQRANQYRSRYEFRLERLEKQKQLGRKKHKKATLTNIADKEKSLEKRKQLISEAVARAKAKKNL